MKRCTVCEKRKPLDHFFTNSSGRPLAHCKQCNAERTRRWRASNPDRQRASARRYSRDQHTRLKLEAIRAYGGACACCGEVDPHFLTIDHIEGVPDHHRRKDGRRLPGSTILLRIRAEGYPPGYRILCFNCNCSIGMFGFCPHEEHDESQRRYPAAA